MLRAHLRLPDKNRDEEQIMNWIGLLQTTQLNTRRAASPSLLGCSVGGVGIAW